MIKVSVLYPGGAGKKFDHEYYSGTHMPMVQRKLGAPLKRLAVERGLAGGEPGSSPPFMAAGHLYFDSVEAFQSAFAPHASAIMGDIPNYTNATPVIQISEVVS
ncbi:MAG: EthD family reductase [Gammaproteobacteria bacterium]|nr:EthD family reductase [Gammaproteobacteria bacterium]